MPELSLNHPFWGRGFRPFFLLAAVYGAGAVAYWVAYMAGYLTVVPAGIDPVLWHAHEMIFGFALAVVAGFLLTAVANWTSWAPVRGAHLAGLVLLWLLGRILPWIPSLPGVVYLFGELAFLPALAVSLYVPLHKTRNVRNYVFVGLLSTLTLLDALFMLAPEMNWLHAALLMILAMASIIGGRIIPAFTAAGLRRFGINVPVYNQQKLDIACLLSLLLLALLHVIPKCPGELVALVAAFSGGAHLWRGRRFHTVHSLKDPLLWILNAGYFWLSLGLLLLAAGYLDWILLSLAWHALTVGAIGSLIIGMMSRVALGHTGRPLVCHRATIGAFYLMQMAALARVLGPIEVPDAYGTWIALAGTAWSVCFALYLWVYVPILLKSRPDRQPA